MQLVLSLPIAVLFATPLSALAALAGVAAAPIIIHLLNRKRYQIVPWAAMRFLLAAQKKNVRRVRLEQLLLLTIRVLIGVLIAGAMIAVMSWMEPLWQKIVPGEISRGARQGRTYHVIVIDASYSMDAKDDGPVSRFEKAKEAAKSIVERARPGDGFSVILAGSPAQAVIGAPADDRDKVAEEIDLLRLPHGNTDSIAGLRLVADLLNRPLDKYVWREVTIITDLKRTAWPALAVNRTGESGTQPSGDGDSWQAIVRNARVVVVDVAREDVDNLAVTSLVLGDPLPLVGIANSLTATVVNHGRQIRKRVPVELRIAAAANAGDKLSFRDAGQQFVDVAPGASVSVTFPLDNQNRFRDPGDFILQVRAGADRLTLDDTRSLAITVRQSIPVLIVNGRISSDPLDTPGAWVRRALRPNDSNSPALPTLIDAEKFANPFQADLTRFDCVFLCDLPEIRWNEVERLEAHLRRGGSVVIGLGPNAAQRLDHYNERLFNDGKGILPGRLIEVRKAEGKDWYSLFADEDSFKHAPLSAYRDETERASLSTPQFHQYIRMDAPANGAARRIFSFLPQSPRDKVARPGGIAGLDPAVVDFPRHRGHVIVYTSAFNPERISRDQHWSSWPPHPSFLPFWHETLRYTVAAGARRNLFAGDSLNEYFPLSFSGLKATLSRSDDDGGKELETVEVAARDEAAVASFSATDLSGIYRISAGSRPDVLLAVNVPVTAIGGGAEGDLRRLTLGELQYSAPEAEFSFDLESGEIRSRETRGQREGASGDSIDYQEPRGPMIAHVLLVAALVLMFVEVILAWYVGSARAANNLPTAQSSRQRWLAFLLWLLPSLLAIAILGAVIHAFVTDRFLQFLPASWRESAESALGVKSAPAGESTEWRLRALPYVTGRWNLDRWLVGILALAATAFACSLYARERVGVAGSERRRFWFDPRLRLAVLRILFFLMVLLVLLPQLSIVFERKGWPDIVLIFDDSRSMATEEDFNDPVLRNKSAELKAVWDKLAAPRIQAAENRIEEINRALQLQPSGKQAGELRDELTQIEKKIRNLRAHHRLNLVKALLASSSQDWLQTLVRDKQMRVHVYRAGEHANLMAELNDPEQCGRMLDEIIELAPESETSRLGDAVATVLKTFRGRSLSAIVMLTDGQTTAGDQLSKTAATAAAMRIPLFFVGVGDTQAPPDLIVGDVKAERVINIKDRLMVEARVSAEGPGMPDLVPLSLVEIVDGNPIERDRRMVPPNGKPVRLSHVPESSGYKKYRIETPVLPGETDASNNRAEHEVRVADMKRVRVLFIEDKPRYEYRFIKTFFERESEQIAGNKSIELSVLQLGAGRDAYKQDKSAIAEFPPWDILQTYDVVILGDFDPKLLPRQQTQMKLLADFVKKRGGGLLVIAGEHFSPHAYATTELADVIPITTDGLPSPPQPKLADPPLTEAFRMRLTSLGANHPIFRFVPDEARNAEIWQSLTPMLWHARGYRRKLSAEVLAVHPTRMAEPGPGISRDELHPLILQQFVGSGRVMFFGFDETWRWRQRLDEPRFNQFWLQTVRSLARSRPGWIELSVERKIYRRDEPIRIEVRFPEDAPAPNPQDRVLVDVERRPLRRPGQKVKPDDVNVETIPLMAREGARATFEALLPRTPEGEYRFVLQTPEVAEVKPHAEAVVLPPVGELDQIRLNEGELILAARLSRKSPTQSRRDNLEAAESPQEPGSRASTGYYPLHQADTLLEDLPEKPRVVLDQPCDPIPLWNHWLIFATFFSVLIVEWVLRKRARLC